MSKSELDAKGMELLERKVASDLEAAADEVRRIAQQYCHSIMPDDNEPKLVKTAEEGGEIYVILTYHGGHIDEFGTIDKAPNAPLRRAISATGMKLEPVPKSHQ